MNAEVGFDAVAVDRRVVPARFALAHRAAKESDEGPVFRQRPVADVC